LAFAGGASTVASDSAAPSASAHTSMSSARERSRRAGGAGAGPVAPNWRRSRRGANGQPHHDASFIARRFRPRANRRVSASATPSVTRANTTIDTMRSTVNMLGPRNIGRRGWAVGKRNIETSYSSASGTPR
jgi:hypothetical protein